MSRSSGVYRPIVRPRRGVHTVLSSAISTEYLFRRLISNMQDMQAGVAMALSILLNGGQHIRQFPHMVFINTITMGS